MSFATPTRASSAADDRPVYGWSGRFADPADERAFAVHRLQRTGRSLAVAALVMAVPWLAFIPVDLVVAPSAAAAAVAVLARLVGATVLLSSARVLWVAPRALHSALRGRYIDLAILVTAVSMLVVIAARPANVATLQISAVVFGIALLLFAPTALAHRAIVTGSFFAGFVAVTAVTGEADVDSALIAANLAMVLLCGVVCSAHLDHTARTAFWHLRRSERLNDRLSAEVASSEALRAVLARRASVDDLTGLLNRRAFFEAADRVVTRLDDASAPAATMVIDADRFKAVNDTYGHAVGDVVLRDLADELRRSLRDGDLIGRLGGEEFCVLLPETDMDEAVAVAERLRRAVAARSTVVGEDRMSLSVSVGVAERRPEEPLAASFLRADRAMYEAKRAGGDRLNCDSDRCRSDRRAEHSPLACASSGRPARHG